MKISFYIVELYYNVDFSTAYINEMRIEVT